MKKDVEALAQRRRMSGYDRLAHCNNSTIAKTTGLGERQLAGVRTGQMACPGSRVHLAARPACRVRRGHSERRLASRLSTTAGTVR